MRCLPPSGHLGTLPYPILTYPTLPYPTSALLVLLRSPHGIANSYTKTQENAGPPSEGDPGLAAANGASNKESNISNGSSDQDSDQEARPVASVPEEDVQPPNGSDTEGSLDAHGKVGERTWLQIHAHRLW